MTTLTFVVTPGASTANSYVSVAEADTYLFAHPDWERWDVLDTVQKERYLVLATRCIDKLNLSGVKADASVTTGGAYTQALEFPRSVDSFNGSLYIHQPVKRACCEQALYLIQTGRGEVSKRRQLQMEGVTDINIAGDIQESYDLKAAKEFSPDGLDILLKAGLLDMSAEWC